MDKENRELQKRARHDRMDAFAEAMAIDPQTNSERDLLDNIRKRQAAIGSFLTTIGHWLIDALDKD